MPARKKERRGGTLSRSETVTVRLDPKLNYLCELAARAQRRTKSSLVEAALAEILNVVLVDPRPSDQPRSKSIAQMAEALWDVDEVVRFRHLADLAPHLMTYEEQKVWSTLRKFPYFWIGKWKDFDYLTQLFEYCANPQSMWLERVRENWDLIKSVAEGKTEEQCLPRMEIVRTKPSRLNRLLVTGPNETADKSESKE